jgi:prepilin-type processing-associated H-X9-DG protein
VPNRTNPPAVGPEYADAQDAGYGYNIGELLLKKQKAQFTYGYNDWGTYDSVYKPQQHGLGGDLDTAGELKAARVKKAAEMIEITDIFVSLDVDPSKYHYNVDPYTDYEQRPSTIHRGGSNVLYCDAHVEWKNLKDLVCYFPDKPNFKTKASPLYIKNARQWNNDNQP